MRLLKEGEYEHLAVVCWSGDVEISVAPHTASSLYHGQGGDQTHLVKVLLNIWGVKGPGNWRNWGQFLLE